MLVAIKSEIGSIAQSTPNVSWFPNSEQAILQAVF